MENVMRNAWVIARKGQNTFGGSVKQYFSEALKIAWSLFKKGGNKMDYAKQVKGTIAQLPPVELEGTEKQVKWALDIRAKAAKNLFYDCVMREQYEAVSMLPGRKTEMQTRPIDDIITALRSKEGINAYFEDMKARGVHESRYADAVESMTNALGRYSRFAEIMSNASAKFWIDNRDNQATNYMFKAFKEYVNTGVKKF